MNRPGIRIALAAGALALAFSLCAPPSAAETGPLLLKPVVGGLSNPIFLCSPPGDNDRLFIIEENAARIRIYKKSAGTLQSAGNAFFDDSNIIDYDPVTPGNQFFPFRSSGESGLLGFAFHPNYSDDPDTPTPGDGNGYFYIYVSVSDPGHKSQVRRFQVSGGDPDRADDSVPGQLILEFDQPFGNHNAGWIGFNPVATGAARYYLYIATGDGGSGNDPGDRAQDITSQPLGKMLRVDVGSDGGADGFPADPDKNYAIPPGNPFVGTAGDDEIWAYGLRNPYRCSFDRQTGDLWIADVGQGAREEVNFQHAASTGGENYGWRVREGLIDNGSNNDPLPNPRVDPILDYPRNAPGNSTGMVSGARYGQSITGGYVYRGPKMPWLDGTYFYADYEFEKVMSLNYDRVGGAIVAGTHTERTQELGLANAQNANTLASFGEDNEGNLYLLKRNGTVFEITQNEWYLWRNAKFSVADLSDPAVSSVTGNPDLDDMENIMEFVAGKDPNVTDGPLPTLFTKEPDGSTDQFLTLTLPRDPEGAFVDLFGESGTSLTDFGSADTTILIDTDTMFKVRDNTPVGPSGPRFLRLNFTLPESP